MKREAEAGVQVLRQEETGVRGGPAHANVGGDHSEHGGTRDNPEDWNISESGTTFGADSFFSQHFSF